MLMLKQTIRSRHTMSHLSVILLLLLLLIGCQTADDAGGEAVSADAVPSTSEESSEESPTPPPEEAAAPQSPSQPAIELSDELDLSFEIDALRQLADQMDKEITFSPAEEADIGWLVEAGVPYDLLHFYALAEPSVPFNANQVEIYPLDMLKGLNKYHSSADIMQKNGMLIIAQTVIGDFYFVDANQADSSTVYLGSHDNLTEDASQADFETYTMLGAISIQQFLAKLAAGQLSYDFYEPQFVAADEPGFSVDPNALETYENEELGIAVTLPVSWIVTGSFSGSGINLFRPGQGEDPFDRSQYISIEQFNSAGSTASLPEEFIQYFESQAEVEKVQLESTRAREINGIQGEELVFRYTISGQELVQQTVILQQDRQTYALSVIMDASLFGQPDDLSIADNVIDSFTPINRE